MARIFCLGRHQYWHRGLWATGLVLVLGAGSAGAEPYVNAQIGYASGVFSYGAPYNGSIDDRSMMLGITGGIGLGRRWAIEGGVHTYEGFDGRATPCPPGLVCPIVVQNVDDNDLTTYRINMVRRVVFGSMQLYGLFGYYHANIGTNINLPDDDFNENGLALGVGARWHFNRPWNVSVEATRLDDHVYQLGFGVGWGARPEPTRELRRIRRE